MMSSWDYHWNNNILPLILFSLPVVFIILKVLAILWIIRFIVRMIRGIWYENRGEEPKPLHSAGEGPPAFCRHCGTRLPEGASFCRKCGARIAMHRRVRIGSLWIWCISLVPLVACIVWICAEWKLDQLVRPLLYFAVPMAFFMWWDRKELSAHGIDIPAKTVWISAFLFWPLYPFRRFGPVYDITHKGLAALITFCVFLTIFGQCLLSKIIEALE